MAASSFGRLMKKSSDDNIFYDDNELFPLDPPMDEAENQKKKTKKDKCEIPWKNKALRQKLFAMVGRLIIVHGAHLAKKNQVTERWQRVLDDLWNQDLFKIYDRIQERSLRQSWGHWVEERKRFHGWESGVPGNLSDCAGELDEADENLKTILIDEEEKDAKAQAIKEEKEQIEKNEITVINRAVSADSKKRGTLKKPAKLPTPSSADGQTSDLTLPSNERSRRSDEDFDIKDVMMAILRTPEKKLTDIKVTEATPKEIKIEREFLKYFVQKERADVLEEAGIVYSDENIEILSNITIDVMVCIFCARGNNFEFKNFVSELRQLGVPNLMSVKLYRYFNVVMSTFDV